MRKICFYLFLSLGIVWGIVWGFGFFCFMNLVSSYSLSNQKINTEAIIVLTGGSNRIESGLELLRRNPSKRLFITGVNSKIKSITHVVRIFSSLSWELQNKIEFGRKAASTFGNVSEVKEWLGVNKINSITLVTSSYHLPRSILAFEDDLPGVHIEGYPVLSTRFKAERWWHDSKSVAFFLKEYSKYSVVFIKVFIKGRFKWIL